MISYKNEKNISDVEYSEQKFDNEIDNLDELFKEMRARTLLI